MLSNVNYFRNCFDMPNVILISVGIAAETQIYIYIYIYIYIHIAQTLQCGVFVAIGKQKIELEIL